MCVVTRGWKGSSYIMIQRKTGILITETNGRRRGLCHNTKYGEMREEGGPLSILVLSFSSGEEKKKEIAKKSEREKEKASVEIKSEASCSKPCIG